MKQLLSLSLLLLSICSAFAQQELLATNQEQTLNQEPSDAHKNEIADKSISQLNLLFNKTYRKAEHELLEKGTFIPFGAIVGTSGKVNFIHVNNEVSVPPEQTVRAIQATMLDLAKQKKIFASAVYYMTKNLETTEGVFNNALIGRLEHATGMSLAIATDLTFSETGIKYSEPMTSQVPSEIFFWVYEENAKDQQTTEEDQVPEHRASSDKTINDNPINDNPIENIPTEDDPIKDNAIEDTALDDSPENVINEHSSDQTKIESPKTENSSSQTPNQSLVK